MERLVSMYTGKDAIEIGRKDYKTEYSEVMQKSFIDYAMSVIVARPFLM